MTALFCILMMVLMMRTMMGGMSGLDGRPSDSREADRERGARSS